MGIQFNGTNTRVDFANESFFDWDWGQAFSVACWVYVRPGAAVGGGAFTIGKAGPPGWALDMNIPVSTNVTFSLHLISTPGQEIWKYGPTMALPYGTWQHICATYDGSSTAAGVNLYQNGLLVANTGGTTIDTPGGSLLNNNPLSVAGTGSGTEWTDVAVANGVLEKRVWTTAEIKSLADITNLNKNVDDLLTGGSPLWWAKLANIGDLADYSGNGNNGTLVGSPSSWDITNWIYIGQRGTGSFDTAVSSNTITFTTTADILAGQHCVLGDSHYNLHGNIASVTVGSLSLSLDKRQAMGGNPVNVEIWSGRATSTISSGATVTVTYDTATTDAGIVVLDVFAGLTSSPVDQTAGTFDTGSVTTFDTGATAMTAVQNELLYAAFAYGLSGTDNIVTPQGGWVETFEAIAPAGTPNLHLETSIEGAVGKAIQREQPTCSTGEAYAGAIVTYKAQDFGDPIAWTTA